LYERDGIDRFRDVALESGLNAFSAIVVRAESCDGHRGKEVLDVRGDFSGTNARNEIQAVQIRHINIAHQHMRIGPFENYKGFPSTIRRPYPRAVHFQKLAQYGPRVRVVIHD
jgi:hypothetical protein